MKLKKKFLFGLAGIAIMAAAVCVTVSGVNTNSSDSDLLTKNLEALTQTELDGVGIVCGGSRGQCWANYHSECCHFTGHQSDYCDFPC